MRAPIALTTGEPAGIGPEVALKAVCSTTEPVVLIGSRELLHQSADTLDLPWPLPGHVSIEDVALATDVQPGHLNVLNAPYVIETLQRAGQGAMDGTYSAVATAPVQKSVLAEAVHPFTGHTEFFATLSGVKHVVMMLVSGVGSDALRVALTTTHLALAEVPAAITAANLDQTLSILLSDLRVSFGIDHPQVAVTGLNPHAGEDGHMGREEIDIITPAIQRARAQGFAVTGPWPADTIFVEEHARKYDAILTMYHDQGLPVLKRVGFGAGVNVTLGLPWIRTSVDHGTALDIAGTGQANAGSMMAALTLAHRLADNRHNYTL